MLRMKNHTKSIKCIHCVHKTHFIHITHISHTHSGAKFQNQIKLYINHAHVYVYILISFFPLLCAQMFLRILIEFEAKPH